MKFTNNAGLPDAICRAIENDDYSKGDAKYSVSNLIQPVQIYHLVKRNMDKIVVDYADEIWKLFGKAVHSILETAKDETNPYLVGEERMYMKIGGIKIGGQPDIINSLTGLLEDYKVTSVWKILKGDYKDWIEQLNMYRLIANHNDVIINRLKIVSILKDWKRFEQARNENYPKIPVAQIEIPLLPLLEVEKTMLERIIRLEEAEMLSDEELAEKFPCSLEDRWAAPPTYALIKPGGKRASFTFESKEEAHQKYIEFPDYTFEVREGKATRCEEFCLAAPFCKQYNRNRVVLDDGGAVNLDDLLPEMKSIIVPEGTIKVEDMVAFKANPEGVLAYIPTEPIEETIKSVPEEELHKDGLYGISFRAEDNADKKEDESPFDSAFQESTAETSVSLPEPTKEVEKPADAFEERFEKMLKDSDDMIEDLGNEEPKPESKSDLESLNDLFKELGI